MQAPLLMGVEGLVLTDAERSFIAAKKPAGFLLFARNIADKEQVRALVAEIRTLVAPFNPLIAVDQEGGRVQRLTFNGRLPAAAIFGAWHASAPAAAREAYRLQGLLLADQLREVGADLVLAPCLDRKFEKTHAVIGDRAISDSPSVIAELGGAFLDGVAAGGCFGCIKHAPGHGRAAADSHFELPVVADGRAELEEDFLPFKALAGRADFLMTAHIRFPELDAENPATYSPRVLAMMRQEWGFGGIILADDVGMQALRDDYPVRITRALEAGCDVVIAALSVVRHGMAGTVFDGDNFKKLAAMELPGMRDSAAARLRALRERTMPAPVDADACRRRFLELWAGGPARMGYTLPL